MEILLVKQTVQGCFIHRCENSHHKFTEYNECFFQVDFSSFKATKRGDVSKSSTSAMAELEFWTLECYKRAIPQVNNHIGFFFIPEVEQEVF